MKTGWRAARFLFAPLNTLPIRWRWLTAFVATLCTAVEAGWANRRMEDPFVLPDADKYVHMARVNVAQVPEPFAWRPLAPLIAREAAAVLHRPVESGFVLLAWCCLLFTAAVVFTLALRTAAPRWFLLPLLVVPFWPQLLNNLALPDPLFAGLLCCLLLLLRAERWPWAAAMMMFPLMLARESTNLVLLCMLIVGWRWLRWGGSVLAVACAGAGTLVVRHLSAGAPGNPEHLQGSLYLIGKLFWNCLRTVGIVPWSNVYPELCGVPQWQHALHVGPVRAVGVCSFSPLAPAQAVVALLSTFGLLPLVCAVLWRQRDRADSGDLVRRFCLLYGAVSYLLSPLLGTWYSRLVGYAWPLFLVGLPALFPAVGQGPGALPWRRGLAVVAVFLGLHAALGTSAFFGWYMSGPAWALGLAAAGVVFLIVTPGRLLLAFDPERSEGVRVVKSS